MQVLERVWSMPDKNTFNIKPIRELLKEEVIQGTWVDPFARNSKWANITNDLNTEFETDYHMDACEFLKMFDASSIDGVLFDPPYSPRQIKEMYQSVGLDTQGGKLTRSSFWSHLKDEIARILKPDGKVICFGWNSQGLGKTRGFTMTKILLVAHGGNHNDTICTVEIKDKNTQLELFQ